jgi:hypothetical protein
MASVTSNARRLDPQVAHPLDRLRGTIRRYVLVEGLLSAAIFVGAWFALGMLLDYGLFKVATWDWVLDAPGWFRLVALLLAAVLLAAILVFRIARRLTRELSYPALALVLERRFPKVLGDRLITAVELADVDRQSDYGYSTQMIHLTINEARDRVSTVPVNDVFNWRRLWVLGVVAVGLVVGVIGFGLVAHAVATRSFDPYRFGWRFAHVTGTFLERNMLLRNTPWPRRAHVELVAFPGDELRIGKDAPDPVVRAKAYRWVVADPAAPMGWRPMAWGDVTENLIDGPVPSLPADAFRTAAEAGTLGGEPATWALDQIQASGLDDSNARAKLIAALTTTEYETLRNGLERVFAALDERAASPSMGRRLRKLDVPEQVRLVYGGQSKSGDVTLSPQQNQEFASPVPDLKETVQFVVRAEDFRTTPRTITLVPPPLFTKLARTEYQPAYLHHAPPQGEGYPVLAGLRQQMAERALSLTGDRSVFPVPSGTEMVLTATTDTDLVAAYLQPKVGILPGAKPGSAEWLPIPVGADKRTVSVEFRGDYRFASGRTFTHYYVDDEGQLLHASVTTTPTVEFDLIVEQADGVRAKRQVMVQVTDDQPPVVEVGVDTIRKVGTVYYVTPRARVPFNPESYVRDDHGLSKLAYEVTYWPEDSEIGRALRAQLVTRPFLYAPGPVGVGEVVAPAYHAVKFKDLDKGDNRKTASFGLGRFEDAKNRLRRDTRAVFTDRLLKPFDDTEAQVVTKVELKSPDEDYFDLSVLKLEVSVSEVQTRYRIDLNLVATDANFDTGPKTGQNAEPIRLLVVSEGDLLAKINEEEESFAKRLDEALAKLAGARKKWEYVRDTNGRDPGAFDTVKVRAQDASQDVAKARDIVQTIAREYRRLHRECVVNRVTEVTRDKFGTFANRIDRVLGETPSPVNDDERGRLAAGLLTPKTTFAVADKRLEAVQTALIMVVDEKTRKIKELKWANPAGVSDADLVLRVLEEEVTAIRKALGELQNRDKLKKMLASVIETQKRIRQELRAWSAEVGGELLKKSPKLSAPGAVFLAKGETKKLKHAINWRQYDKDDVVVKLTVTDKDGKPVPADVLGAAPELKLNFEKNQIDFEYDVKAGAKEGEYTLTLTPEVGDPVTVTVMVK